MGTRSRLLPGRQRCARNLDDGHTFRRRRRNSQTTSHRREHTEDFRRGCSARPLDGLAGARGRRSDSEHDRRRHQRQARDDRRGTRALQLRRRRAVVFSMRAVLKKGPASLPAGRRRSAGGVPSVQRRSLRVAAHAAARDKPRSPAAREDRRPASRARAASTAASTRPARFLAEVDCSDCCGGDAGRGGVACYARASASEASR